MTREEHDLRAQIVRLLKVFPAAEPSVQRGIISQIGDLYREVLRNTKRELEVPRYILIAGAVFDLETQTFARTEEIDPETILPKEY